MLVADPKTIVFNRLQALHQKHPEAAAFCAFPDDAKPQTLTPFHVPAAELFERQTDWGEVIDDALVGALIALSPDMMWRETYKGTDISADFMERFGCYEIIGRDAPFASEKMRGFLVYQPPHLHYPWHHHPAEELYVVLAGQAEFHVQGMPSETLKAGQASFHPSGSSHALTTHDHPVIAYVVWRDDFDIAPVWSDR